MSAETVRLVVEAVPKYPVPDTVSAVEEAYGRTLAAVAVLVMALVMASVLSMVDDAWEMNPLANVARPVEVRALANVAPLVLIVSLLAPSVVTPTEFALTR